MARERINKRLSKKLNKKAMLVLIETEQAKSENFSYEEGELVCWYQSGWLEPEWDYMSPYEMLGFQVCKEITTYDETGWHRQRIRNSKQFFSICNLIIEKHRAYKNRLNRI